MTETRGSSLGGPLFVAGAVIMVVGLLGIYDTGRWWIGYQPSSDSLER